MLCAKLLSLYETVSEKVNLQIDFFFVRLILDMLNCLLSCFVFDFLLQAQNTQHSFFSWSKGRNS